MTSRYSAEIADKNLFRQGGKNVSSRTLNTSSKMMTSRYSVETITNKFDYTGQEDPKSISPNTSTKSMTDKRKSIVIRSAADKRKSITEDAERYFSATFTTEEGDWEVRPEVKFRFSPAYIKYATAHPQPKPILRLHSSHKVGELKAVASNLSAAYLRNKCPHGLGALSHTLDTLTNVVPSNEYKNKKNAIAAAADAFTKNKKINIATAMRAVLYHQAFNATKKTIAPMPTPPTPPPNNGIYIGDVEILAHDPEGYGVKVRHNAQGDYPTYNPTNDDSHNMLLPENLIKKILRMRPNFLGQKFKLLTLKYQQERLDGICPFKMWIKMNKRRRKINKKRITALTKLANDTMCADRLAEHVNSADLMNPAFIACREACIDTFDDCPEQLHPVKYYGTFFDAQSRFEHTRIGLYYEERRQLIARGIIDPLKITNKLGVFDKGCYPSSCRALLYGFTYEGLCGTPGSVLDKKIAHDIKYVVERAQRHPGTTRNLYVIGDAERNSLKIKVIKKDVAGVARTSHANPSKITRKTVLGCSATVNAIKKLVVGTKIAAIVGKTGDWKKMLPFVITRFNVFDADRHTAGNDCWVAGGHENYYCFTIDSITRGKNPRGVSTSSRNTNLYEMAWRHPVLTSSQMTQGEQRLAAHKLFKEIVNVEIACYKAWLLWNERQGAGRKLKDIMAAVRHSSFRAPYADEKVVYGGKVLVASERSMPKYQYAFEGGGCSWELRLPYLNHDGVDGVRYTEMDYAVNDLIKTHTFDEHANRRESCCLVKNTNYPEHQYALDGGQASRAWSVPQLTTGDCAGLLTNSFREMSTYKDRTRFNLHGWGRHDKSTGFWLPQ